MKLYRATHICIGNLSTIGSDNGLAPDRRQAIIWLNVGILLVGPLETNFSENLIEILTFSFKKMRLKVSSAKCGHFVSASMWGIRVKSVCTKLYQTYQSVNRVPWSRHGMETLSPPLALCERNPSVTDGKRLLSQRNSYAELWCFLCCYPEDAAEQNSQDVGDFKRHDGHWHH